MLNLIYIVLSSYVTVAWFWISWFKRLLKYNKSEICCPINSQGSKKNLILNMDWKATLRVVILGVMLLGDGKLFLSFILLLIYIWFVYVKHKDDPMTSYSEWDIFIYITHVPNHCLFVVEFGGGDCIWF